MDGNAQVKAFIDRILRLKEEQDALATDIREVYAEAKSCGFDKTALGEVVSYLRKIEKKGKDAVSERTAMFDLYLVAYEGPSHTHAREATQSYAEAKGREYPNIAPELTAAEIEELCRLGPGELTDTQEQPETDEPCDYCADRAKPGEYYHCPKCDTEWFPEEDNSPTPSSAPRMAADDEAAQAPQSSSAPTPSAADNLTGAVKAPEAESLPASGASNPVNRKCQKHKRGEFCGFAYSQASCWRCNQAAQQSEVAA